MDLKKNISLLTNEVLTEEVLEKVSQFVDNRIENYLKELRDEDEYIAKTVNKIKIADAEVALSELYFKSQIYFLYNEVFTYGAMDLILRKQITKNKLDVEKTLLGLSNYKGTAVHTVYKMLTGFQIPNTKLEFIKLQKRDAKFRKAIGTLSTNIADYFEEKPTLNEIYYMIKAASEHANSVNTETSLPDIGKPLIQLYVFIVNTQRKLFISQNIYINATKKIFKKFPKLDKVYGGQKPKGPLLDLYLDKIKELKGHKLLQPNIYYNGFVFNLDERKHTRLSDRGSKIIEAIINKKVADGISILDAGNIVKKLNDEGIIEKDVQKPKKPSSYIFMLELALGCNLNCTICFNRGFKRQRIVTVDEWCKIIYSIPKGSQIILFGGEPFFYPWVGKIIDYIQETNKKEERHWKVEAFTNGVLTNKILDSLKGKERLKLIFSIDGLQDAHDTIRGKGAFNHAIETIKRLKTETLHEIEVRSVVTAKNYNSVKEFINFFKRLGVDEITFTDLHVTGNAKKHLDYVLTPDQRLNVLHWLGNYKDSILTNGYSDSEIYPNSCGIGFNRIYIRSDGLVNGCSELDVSEYNISNAKLNKKGVLENPRNLIPKFERDEFNSSDSDCAKCGLLYLCGGGCRSRALKQTGNINSCDVVQKEDIIRVLNKIKGN
jgi:radical SAM protein with 4Fe4S-binding SPASM domain